MFAIAMLVLVFAPVAVSMTVLLVMHAVAAAV